MDYEKLVSKIVHETGKGNMDNISRTCFYESYFFRHPEIKWALLAGLVSRNAGWNMCDLKGTFIPKILPTAYIKRLFLTYERANWLIFDDAYPQLLVYHYSTMYRQPMFHLLANFRVSKFMRHEWERFWETGDEKRLLYALIINEQNIIQKPVISHPYFRKKVFQSIPFKGQDFLHYSIVIFPTIQGELYGASVKKFVNVDERIELGKTLANILFHPKLYPMFLTFIKRTTHTGSRYDYEKYFSGNIRRTTPFLRLAWPVISHQNEGDIPWDEKNKIKKRWFAPPKWDEPVYITDWYHRKRKEMEIIALFQEWFQLKK